MQTAAALLTIARAVGEIFAGSATGGSTTSLVDTLLAVPNDDIFNGGTLFFLSGTNAGKTAVITDYTGATRTFNFATTGAVAAGDRYEATTPRTPRALLVSALNMALEDMGALPTVNSTLTVLASTEEYTLPAGVSNLRRVEVAGADAEPYGWNTSHHWMERGGKLVFLHGQQPMTAGKKIRAWYQAAHVAVSADADTINDLIHPVRLRWAGAYYTALEQMRNERNDKSKYEKLVGMFQAKMNEAAAEHPIRPMPRDPIFAGF